MVFASYLIHIYRFKKNNPRALVGIVEEVGVKGRKAFTNYDELWQVLNSPTPSLPSLEGRREIRKDAFEKDGRKKGGDDIL